MSSDTGVDMDAESEFETEAGTGSDATEAETGAGATETGAAGAAGKGSKRGRVLQWVAVVVAAVMLAVGIVGFLKAHDLRSDDAMHNRALVDATATAEVQSQVSQALVKVLSYDYADPSSTEQAASRLLAGKARTQYDTLFKTLQDKAPGQQLVLTAEVQSAAVKTLTDSTATLLVFLDQASQRKSDSEASVSAAQLAVDATKIDGIWKVTGLDPL